MGLWDNLFGGGMAANNQSSLSAIGSNPGGFGMGGTALHELGGAYVGTGQAAPSWTQVVELQQKLSDLQMQIAAFDSVRRQDAALRNTYFKTMMWLKEAHPEILEEYHAMIALLKASGETL